MRAYLFLTNGFEEIEVVCPVSILRSAGFDISTVSIEEGLSVTGAHGVSISADVMFNDKNMYDADVIILPGGQPGTNNLQAFIPLRDLISFYSEHRFVAAICAAPVILGQMNLLKGKKAVCYPGFEDQLLGAVRSNSNVVIDGNIITAVGPGAAREFAMAIVNCLQ